MACIVREKDFCIHVGVFLFFFLNPHLMIFIDLRERENHRCKRETSISCLLYMSQPWMETTI